MDRKAVSLHRRWPGACDSTGVRNQSITALRRALGELGFQVTLVSRTYSEKAQDVRFDLPRDIDDDVVRLIVSTTLKYFQLPVFVYQDMERENSEVHVGLASGDLRDTVPYAKVIEILNSESGGVAEQLLDAMKE